LALEDRLRRLSREELEAALGVVKRQPGDQADAEVERPPGEFSKKRLVDADQRAVERAGADGSVTAAPLDGVEQLGELFDRRR